MDIKEVTTFLKNYDGEPIAIAEVCGTHTASICENAIPSVISDKITLISGPGCPVCVTVSAYIDRLCELAKEDNTCVVTFGDMIRVAGSRQSLADVRAQGGRVKMVYSPLEIIDLAKADGGTLFVFAAVGFETTTPVYAVLLERIINENIKNIKLLTALKTMPAAIEYLCTSGKNIDGFIAPGHVAVITGSKAFEGIAAKYSRPFVVSGFKGTDLMCALYSLVKLKGKGKVLNIYKSAVTRDGNVNAQRLVQKYFEPCGAAWRGIGILENSGMALRREYLEFDAGSAELIADGKMNEQCRCGEIITGRTSPLNCPLFGRACRPESPQGACMVSMEGACFNYFNNNRQR